LLVELFEVELVDLLVDFREEEVALVHDRRIASLGL
jgi:hypothetical protein